MDLIHPVRPVLELLVFRPEAGGTGTPADYGLDYTDVPVVTADGCELSAWFVRARGGRAPLGHILYAHGNAGNISGRMPVLALLADAGFDVLVFDYRGYGRSTGRPSEQGMYLDARAARAALLAQPEVDPERVLYFGKSLGGGVLLELAQAHPPAGLILVSTFTGLRDVVRSLYPLLPAFTMPDAFPSLRRVRTLRSPVLIMHGERDELVPVGMGRDLFAAAPEPKRLHIYPRAMHNTVPLQPGWNTAVADWAREVLAAVDGTPARGTAAP
ncbi:alpha/beta hydrolase [Nocardia stercoris]|uniref:Alpha/beta hydrolase n=1 Tax=Nocardia stercoris TaxID=2483361 RepID=A0A3M2KZK9_9NOCA|nr:alpha/beta hydrolase [Nocardia stercoris]RMI29890.1 alpha/beta hydrolase [Nocardia stercoris]